MNYKHGMTKSRPYKIWVGMRARCDDINNKDYPRYGGRGISYCDKWKKFNGFWEDMKEGYSDGLTLDRIEANGNYCKENCRWADYIEQANNRRDNILYCYKGETDTLKNLSRKFEFNYHLVIDRLNSGQSIEEAIEKPNIRKTYNYKDLVGTPSEIAKVLNLDKRLLAERLRNGWAIEKAIETPKNERGK